MTATVRNDGSDFLLPKLGEFAMYLGCCCPAETDEGARGREKEMGEEWRGKSDRPSHAGCIVTEGEMQECK